MIRKVLHSIIAVFILVTSTGFAINLHYCHDQLIDMTFLAPAHTCCDINDEDANQVQDSCPGCQDKSIVV